MAVIEKDGLYQYIDENGNIYILYPVTKLDNVSGTGKLVHLKDGTTLQTLDGTNIALITEADLEALSNTANADTRVEYVDNVLKTLGGTEVVTGNARIATGSYTGTGKFGENNKSVLTFDFAPKLVIIFDTVEGMIAFFVTGSSIYFQSEIYSGTEDHHMNFDNNTLTWWWQASSGSGVNRKQMNVSGNLYSWIAIA